MYIGLSQLHYEFVACSWEFIAQAVERITFPSASKTVALALSEAWDEFFGGSVLMGPVQ
jgi:hypothetical protein